MTRDDAAHTASLKAEGRDTTGKGTAAATITAQLTSVTPTSTKCTVVTDLTISGKVAQFGRGALADVSDKLLAQFADNLNQLISSAPATTTTSTTTSTTTTTPAPVAAASPEIRKIESAEVAPLDLLGTAGAPILKRAIPVVVALIVAVIAAIKFL